MCALVASVSRYRSTLAQALHMGQAVAPPLLYLPSSHACRQAATNATVDTVKRLLFSIFFAVRSSLFHLAPCTPFEKNGLHSATVRGSDCLKISFRQNNGLFRLTVLVLWIIDGVVNFWVFGNKIKRFYYCKPNKSNTCKY